MQAAGLLKRAEGIVTLTLCNPNKKEGEPEGKPDDSVAVDGKVEAKKAEPPPEPEAPKDPATATIDANKETLIDVTADKKPLGIVVVKGDCSQVQVSPLLGCVRSVYTGPTDLHFHSPGHR